MPVLIDWFQICLLRCYSSNIITFVSNFILNGKLTEIILTHEGTVAATPILAVPVPTTVTPISAALTHTVDCFSHEGRILLSV